MTAFEEQKEEMFRFLEIYDGYEALLDVSESLVGCEYGVGYGEGALGKLLYIVDIVISRSDPSLYNRSKDFCDSRLFQLLEDREMDNHVKAEYLLGLRR